jgi:glycosyltransferase involved in cell wall biosynthesis
MAAGLPVIASDLAVHREVCADAGLFFPAFSPSQLADTICRVAESPALMTQMLQRGLKRSKDISWKDHVARMISVAGTLLQ